MKTDICIIGGGIVGLATSYQLSQNFPDKKVVIVEKENSLAKHQTGHNSGVLHSGIYYKPGSLKAINCRMGKQAMEAFCEEQEIEHELCGKVIVALNEEEIPRMEKIYQLVPNAGVLLQSLGLIFAVPLQKPLCCMSATSRPNPFSNASSPFFEIRDKKSIQAGLLH